MTGAHVMILAGEASGDAHAADFVEQLKLLEPDIRFSGMGSQAMARAGVDLFYDSSAIAVVGLVEVLHHWGDIKKAMNIVRHQLDTSRPDLLVLVDYPEFNLKMARHAKQLGIKVLFYISPQVWAWRPKRIQKIGRRIDHMAVIFDFEQDYYQRAGIPVSFVGHPLVDKVKVDGGPAQARSRLGFSPMEKIIGLFPGSRRSEVTRLLPVLFATAARMQADSSRFRFLLPVAPGLDFENISRQAADTGLSIEVTRENLYDVISSCDAIATCSGTVTLEIALLKVPMCILCKVSGLSYLILSRLITIPYIGLPNIVAGKAVVREFFQDDVNPETLGNELMELTENSSYREQIRTELSQVKENLGAGDGARKMAQLVLSLLP